MNKIILTGMAGFIGCFLAKKFIENGYHVLGLDNLNDYYEVALKIDRLNYLGFDFNDSKDIKEDKKSFASKNLAFIRLDLKDKEKVRSIFEKEKPDIVVHMAAQAGVRYSIENPYDYIDNNILVFLNILESCRRFKVNHLLYASSSSVYGLNQKMPYSEEDYAVHPVSLYGATKKSNELMAHAYSKLYSIPTTGLRLFTVYGPLGRPDMSLMIFTQKILKGEKLDIFNFGRMKRDFTFIDDITQAIYLLLNIPPDPNSNWDQINHNPQNSSAPYRVLNIGNGQPVNLEYFISTLESEIGKKAKKKLLPMQKGDVLETFSDTSELYSLTGFKPQTSLKDGIKKFIIWYRDYYGINK